MFRGFFVLVFCISLFIMDMDELYANTSRWDSCRMGCCSTALNQTLSSDIGLLKLMWRHKVTWFY